MSRPSSRNAARPKTPVSRSYERPEPKRIISKHLGTVLEDGLPVYGKAELSDDQYEAARAAFRAEAGGASRLGPQAVKRALLRLDDTLFQRLVEHRWHSYTDSDDADHGPGGGGIASTWTVSRASTGVLRPRPSRSDDTSGRQRGEGTRSSFES
ncbi:unnamed protein product [Ectocarpus sp. 6 AP-2014]